MLKTLEDPQFLDYRSKVKGKVHGGHKLDLRKLFSVDHTWICVQNKGWMAMEEFYPVLCWVCLRKWKYLLAADISPPHRNAAVSCNSFSWKTRSNLTYIFNTMAADALVVLQISSHRWIPLTKASDMELWCFLRSTPEQTVEQTNWDASDLRCHDTHYDVTVMSLCYLISFLCRNGEDSCVRHYSTPRTCETLTQEMLV